MAKELTFLKANVILTGTQLMTGNEQYPLSDISYAEVVTRRYPVDWWSFIQVNTIVFLGFAALWAILTAFGWGDIPGPLLAIWWLFIFIRSAACTLRARTGILSLCKPGPAPSKLPRQRMTIHFWKLARP